MIHHIIAVILLMPSAYCCVFEFNFGQEANNSTVRFNNDDIKCTTEIIGEIQKLSFTIPRKIELFGNVIGAYVVSETKDGKSFRIPVSDNWHPMNKKPDKYTYDLSVPLEWVGKMKFGIYGDYGIENNGIKGCGSFCFYEVAITSITIDDKTKK